MLLRIFADTALIIIAIAAALVIYMLSLHLRFGTGYEDMIIRYFRVFMASIGPLIAISLLLFYLNGFYTYGLYYQGRYKIIVVTYAISQSYLVYGFLSYFFSIDPDSNTVMPRTALVIAWGLTIVLVVGARIWNQMWEKIVNPEREGLRRASRGEGKLILVIGGAGYIGSALLPKLLERGYRVRLLDMLMFGKSPIANLLDHPKLEVIEGDFRHVENVVQAMQGVDSVIHLGAIVGDPACALDEDLTIDVNLSATRMIAELAKAAGIDRFIFASTCSVYGACDEMLDERSWVRPVSLYGHTKLASERVLRKMADVDFQPTIVRFATIYGLSGRTRFDLVVNILTAKAKIDGVITVFGGDQWRPFVHVDDAALAVATVLDAPKQTVSNQIFNIGSNEQNYTIDQIGEIVKEQIPEAELQICGNDGDTRNYKVDFRKIRNVLNFIPQWTIETGIQQVVDAFETGKVTDYTETIYSNVKSLTSGGAESLDRDRWARDLIKDVSGEGD